MSSSALFLLLVSAGVVLALPPSPWNRIIGGEIFDISTFPWQVALLENGRYVCGGTVICTRWILTAAHCIPEADATILGVRAGSNNYASGGQYYEIEQVINHEEYVNYITSHDISLLKAKIDIVLSAKVAIATFPDQDEAPPVIGDTFKVSGWGLIDINHLIKPDDLYAVDVKLLEFSKCKNEYPQYNLDENIQLCSASLDLGFCMGDSGGPLVHGSVLRGTTSFGGKFCGDVPSVYIDISYYIPWIKEKTRLPLPTPNS